MTTISIALAAVFFVPSVLWRCWLGGRKGIWPVKNWVVRCWRGYLSEARCRLAYAQLMTLPLTVSCFSKIQIGFTFLVPAHQGSPRKRDVKRVCVCVCVCNSWCFCIVYVHCTVTNLAVWLQETNEVDLLTMHSTNLHLHYMHCTTVLTVSFRWIIVS